MGWLHFVAIIGALAVIAYRFSTDQERRRRFRTEMFESPATILAAMAFVAFFVGVFIPILEMIRFPNEGVRLAVWMIGAAGCLAGFWFAALRLGR